MDHTPNYKRKEIHKDLRKQYLAKEAKENLVGFFTVWKHCKSMKTTYYQMQTRSADEPMTTVCKLSQLWKKLEMLSTCSESVRSVGISPTDKMKL